MMKRRNKLTIRGLLFALVMLMGTLGRFPLTASAAGADDLPVEITGADGNSASVTLEDTDKDGYYEIGTADELYAFAAAVNDGNGAINGELTADIVVNENVLKTDGNLNDDSSSFRVWTPIGTGAKSFTGTFDGAGHTISGLYFNYYSTQYVGLFGAVGADGMVKKVGVTDSYFNGNSYVGGIAGTNNGTIINCYTMGTVDGMQYVGGVVGTNWATVASCYNAGKIIPGSNYKYVGGIVGDNNYSNSKIQNCFFNSTLYSGTAVGKVSSGETDIGTVDNITGGKDTAAFASGEVAYLLNGDQTELVFKQTLGTDAAPNFTGEPVYKAYIGCAGGTVYSNDEALKDINVEHLFNNVKCAFCSEYQSATQNAAGYYEIDNASKLFWFAKKVNKGDAGINGKLTKDIVVNESVLADGSLNGDGTNFLEWTPIGTSDAGFTGTFDGAGHTISGLYFNDKNTSYVGLFGVVGTGGTVQKVGVTDSYFYGNEYVGGIAGQNGGTIRNCYNSGAINGWGDGSAVSDYYYIGGVVGNNTSTVENCYNVGSVVSYSSAKYAGGLVGNRGTVINSYSIEGAYSSHNTGGGGIGGGIGGGGGGGGGSDDADEDTDSKTAEQFASGEVAYLLNGDQTELVWGQNIGTDSYPVLGGATVYFGYLSCADDADRIYTNDSTASETKPEHDINIYSVNGTDSTKHDGTCSNCGAVVKEDHTSEKDENKATCKKQAVCDNCGESYGEKDKDHHANEVIYSLTEDGTQHVATWSCCGVNVTENHSTTAEGDKAANCGSQAYCSVCDRKYGEVDKNNHDETVEYKNGFCPHCDSWEPAVLKDGYYQIKNAGNLYWYADYVNTKDRTASAVLVADIDLEGKSDGTGRKWTPIGSTGESSNNFRGVFDGQGHTITGLYVEGGRAGLGFFGEVRTGTVKNFTIYGDVVVNTEVDYVGGVIGSVCGLNSTDHGLERNGATLQNITSYVNLTAKAHGVGMIGGFVGYANHQSLIEKCSWYGTFDAGVYRVDNGAGGFIGRIQENSSEVTIRNCAAYGTIKTNYAGDYNNTTTIYMGGFLSYSNTGAKTVLENCLFAGKFVKGENLTAGAQLAAFGTLSSIKSIENCYYLADDGLAAVHTGSEANAGGITLVTAEQLKSGEVAHLLQGEQTEQIWGQTIDTDSYPVLDGDAVYQVLNCKEEVVYSNTNENLDHQWDNGICTVCGATKTYSITISPTENGTVTAGAETAAKGTKVTLNITPATGYYLDSLTVVDENDEKITVENNTFVMPEAPVTVIAVFTKDSGDFVIEGAAEGWNVTDDVLTFTQGGAYTVSLADGKTETAQVIVVDAEGVTLTLNQITINAPDGIHGNIEDDIEGTEGACALTLNCDVALVLAGENTLIGGDGGSLSVGYYTGYDGGAGISALDDNYTNNMVTVSGEGSLTAQGGNGADSYKESAGNGGAGIDGSVTLYGGTVTVLGGTAGVDGESNDDYYNGVAGVGLTGTITVADGKMLKIKAGDSDTSAEEKTVYSGEKYAEFAVCVAAMVGKSLSINGDIGVNFYLKLDEDIDTENASVKFILPGGEEVLEVSEVEFDSERGAYKLSTSVAAAEMVETITVQVFTGDSNEAAEEFTYSVVDYAKTIFGDQEKYKDTVPLMQTMLNYGAMAQTYFDRNTENPANAILSTYGLSTELSDISPDALEQFEANIPENGLPEGISYAGTSLLLEAEVTLRHYFTLAEGATAPTVNDGWNWVERNGKYYAEKTNIAAAELDTMQSLTIGGGWTMQYSPLSYAKKVLEAEETRTGAHDLMKALYYYNQAANEYFANKQ